MEGAAYIEGQNAFCTGLFGGFLSHRRKFVAQFRVDGNSEALVGPDIADKLGVQGKTTSSGH